MRLIDRPWKTPGRCALVAHVDPVTVPHARWIDTDGILQGWDQHVFLSDVGVRQAMSVFGFPTPLEHEAVVAQLAVVEAELAAARARMVELEGELAAVDVLESADFTRRRKAGRPKAMA
jgi:hypothetical protein